MGTTPLLRQYFEIREQYPEALLLFQVGDFYEIFFDDAKRAAAYLGITLTKRGTYQGEPVPLCGVPLHTLDHYLVKLVKGGFRVAICDQLTAAQPGKVVKRGVTKVLTPGTLTDIRLLDDKSASYCAAIFPTLKSYGCVFVELLTGHIFTTVVSADDKVLLEAELRRFSPDEILLPNTKLGCALEKYVKRNGYVTTMLDYDAYQEFSAGDFANWFQSCQVPSRDIIEHSAGVNSALVLLYGYLYKNQKQALEQCRQVFFYSPEDFLMLDASTQKNLEIVKNLQDGSSTHTLFSVLDHATTSMGSRMIRKWLVRPLIKKDAIEQRLNVVEFFVQNLVVREEVMTCFKHVGDIERVIGRIALQRAHLHDYTALSRALAVLPHLQALLGQYQDKKLLKKIVTGFGDFSDLSQLLDSALNSDTSYDWKIKKGYSQDLDRLRSLTSDGAQGLLALERREQEKTGIQSLKVKYNKVQGYAIEVTKANLSSVPEHYLRLQTLKNCERYTTQELKDLEYDISRAHSDSLALENELYNQICEKIAGYGSELKRMAQSLAQCDALIGFACAAYKHNYVRPFIAEGRDIVIRNGRHPVVAEKLGHDFIPNNADLVDTERTWIITGPNMGGKSTFLRQVALLSLMAQAGSFVPADSVQLPLLDRIFTRIGAADNVAEGKSTFLVEMEETALICNQATEKSLVILDEVGRGTSTYDGLAIAQAVVEYLHERVGARALFATHYHELTALSDVHDGIASYHAASKKTEDGIILMHKIIRGSADGSFGIEVAKGVQLPSEIVMRAEQILVALKMQDVTGLKSDSADQAVVLKQQNQDYALKLAELKKQLQKHRVLQDKVQSIDYDNLSPKKAFDILWDFK